MRIFAALTLTCYLGMGVAFNAQGQAPQTRPSDPQKPATPASKPPADANPFPEDTNSVPVMPSSSAPADVPAAGAGDVHAPAQDGDPVRSPDDPMEGSSDSGDSSSSSFAGIDKVLPPAADNDTRGKKGRNGQEEPEHQESAKEDENVGNYYLGEHNWKAALSRFESAVVLDPENPDVYWGLAEAQHHLGKLADAKANYLKVIDYDPDSKHGKDARKMLKDPDLANAPSVSASKP
jgi:tetratricopeptide (TPR) repeat protein